MAALFMTGLATGAVVVLELQKRYRLTRRDLDMIDRLRRKGLSKSQAMIKLNLIED